MPYAHKRQVKVAYVIPARVRGRPHPNPPPEGEGICHTPSKGSTKHSVAAFVVGMVVESFKHLLVTAPDFHQQFMAHILHFSAQATNFNPQFSNLSVQRIHPVGDRPIQYKLPPIRLITATTATTMAAVFVASNFVEVAFIGNCPYCPFYLVGEQGGNGRLRPARRIR